VNILDGQSNGKNAIENTLQEQKQCIDTFIVSKQRRIKLILFFLEFKLHQEARPFNTVVKRVQARVF
jgi:hypothetical protein